MDKLKNITTMGYSSKIKESKEKVYHHAIATKIRELMGKLRKSANEDRKRRWIWELLQNAKDASFSHQKVVIGINHQLRDEQSGNLIFRHNGRPFSVDNVTFLVEQVSTKDQKTPEGEKPKETGKFGTGFLTTHLLSEKVEVESVIKDEDLPHRKFKLLLDRSGREIDEIINSVNNSLEMLSNLDNEKPLASFIENDFNTTFCYELNKNGNQVAQIGIIDLHKSLPFTLAFSPKIKSVNIENENTSYELLDAISNEGTEIQIFTIQKNILKNRSEIKIAVLSNKLTSIAIEIEYINGNTHIKQFDDEIPKLFCDFPLVGSETFNFPTIINNSTFSPTEPRDGIDLTDNEDIDIEKNKIIINEAIELYFKLLDYASKNNWQNIHLLADISKSEKKEWISETWFKDVVLNPIRAKLLYIPIVDTENNKRLSILNEIHNPNIFFPSAKKEVRDRIFDLCKFWIPQKLPRHKDVDKWYNIIWGDCAELNLKVIASQIQEKKTLQELAIALKGISPIDWLNSYYNLLIFEDNFIEEITNNKYSIFPNQNGEFKKFSELFIDQNIDEELKETLSILKIDARAYLLNNNIKINGSNEEESKIWFKSKEQEEIIKEINDVLSEGKNSEISKACDYLISLFSEEANFPVERTILYDFCKTIFPNDIPEKRKIKNWQKEIWQEVDKLQIKYIISELSDSKDIQTVSEKINFDEKKTVTWLHNFIIFLVTNEFDNFLNLKKTPILPNQNGKFVIKDELFLDGGDIGETLKDISNKLGVDFRECLLNKDIYLELPEARVYTASIVAQEITKNITPLFSEIPRSEETKYIFKELFLWFNENKHIAQNIFSELYVLKHKLYDDDEIANSMQKVELVDEIMKEFDLSDMEDLRRVLKTKTFETSTNNQKTITQEVLASLGVTSISELEKALENKDLASNFTHISTPTVEMFLFAQNLIQRAKNNIKKHLDTLPIYDTRECEEIAPTVLAGIKKSGIPIYIVVRPSDNHEVIVYYVSEKDTLDYENAELWIDNGKETPKHLTLGKIFKATGINKIPV